jgi:cephalosporin hydroxylase
MNLFRHCSPARFSGLLRRLCPTFFQNLLDHEFVRHTDNYGKLTWLGNPIWQNIADLWVIQEVVSRLRPTLIIETGTNRGGSSLFYAHLMDLLGHGSVITVDVEKMHDIHHPRITHLLGGSTDPVIVETIRHTVASINGPVMVILDSDHSQSHVENELKAYHSMVTPGSYMLVQDGLIDILPGSEPWRPGPLPAIQQFLAGNTNFQLDHALCRQFPISHHPQGWLKRIA